MTASTLLRSREMLEKCFSGLPQSCRMLKRCIRNCPRAEKYSTGSTRATAEPQNALGMPLELGAARCSKSASRVTAARCVCCLRSKWPLRQSRHLFVYYHLIYFLGSALLRACYARVHIGLYIYIYIYTQDNMQFLRSC